MTQRFDSSPSRRKNGQPGVIGKFRGAPLFVIANIAGVFAAGPSASDSRPDFRSADPLDSTVWSSSCTDRTRRQLQFMKRELTYIIDVYADESCSEKLGSLMRIGGYEVRNASVEATTSARGAWPLDFTPRIMSWTPQTQRFANALNSIGECGIRDWKSGAARSFLGRVDVCYYLEASGPWAGAPQLPPVRDEILLEWVELSGNELRISEGFGTRRHRDARTRELLPVVFRRE